MRSDGDTIHSVVVEGTSQTDSLRVVCSDTGGDIVDAPFDLRIVVGHMTTAAGGVSSLGDTIEDHLLDSHTSREGCQQVSIVEEKVVLAPLEDLSDGKLNTIVPCIRGVELPSNGLQ